MGTLPKRHTDELRKGRVSQPGAKYFLTCVARRPEDRLTERAPSGALGKAVASLVDDGDMVLLCGTLMPDHLHLLFVLGHRLLLYQVVAKLKGKSRPILAASGVRWQENFFEHRLRPDETNDPYARYVFMNPYRAGLLGRREVWPHWMIGEGADFDFLHLLEDEMYPPEEWFDEPEEQIGVDPGFLGNE